MAMRSFQYRAKARFQGYLIILALLTGFGLSASFAQTNGQPITSIKNVDRVRQLIEIQLSKEEYRYVATEQPSGEQFSEATHRFLVNASGEIEVTVHWVFSDTAIEGIDQSKLAKDYSTISAQVVVNKEGSDYTANRIGNVIKINGVFRNKTISKSIEIDENPFYTNPTIGLKGFILSGKEKAKFWLLRPDKPELLKMRVTRYGAEIIEIGGRRLEAIKLEWGLTGIGSLFFNEVYWFDRKNKVFLKNINRDGIVTEMVF
jgi:hypothetical protein